MLKKYNLCFVFFVLFFLLSYQGPVYAVGNNQIYQLSPEEGENNVSVSKVIKVKFQQDMDKSTIDEFSVYLIEESSKKEIQTSVNYNESTRTLTLSPLRNLQEGSIYDVILADTIKTDDGDKIKEFQYNFRTEGDEQEIDDEDNNDVNTDISEDVNTIADVYVMDMKPLNNATNVMVDSLIEFSFSGPMDLTTINTDNIHLYKESGEPIGCTVNYDYSTYKVTMKPIVGLEPATLYKVKIDSDVLSNSGEHFAWIEWKFTTKGTENTSTTKGTMYNPLVTFNGKMVQFNEAKPYIKNKRAMVPMRNLFELLDAQMTWNNDQQKIMAILNDSMIELYIGKKAAYKNGKTVILDAAPEISKNYTMVPLRFAAESLGVKISWDSKNYIINLTQ